MTEDYSEFVKIMPASQPALSSQHGLRVLSMVVRSQNCLRNIRRLGFLRIQRWNSARIALASVNSQARMLTLRGFDTAFDAEHRPQHDRA